MLLSLRSIFMNGMRFYFKTTSKINNSMTENNKILLFNIQWKLIGR